MNQQQQETSGDHGQAGQATWVEFFSTLPDASRILDVGTGDGMVALVAQQTAIALGRKWEIDATDPAQVDPQHLLDGKVHLLGITFHPGVATEQLPFDSERFDAVSGHCTLEYTNTVAALAEVYRVLKPGGDAQFVLHHADSVLVRSARESLREAELVFTQTQAFRHLRKLVTMEKVTTETEAATTALRTSIQELKEGLQQARQAGAGDLLGVALDAIQKLLVARKGMAPHAVGLEVDRAEAELRESMRQLGDIVEHASTSSDMDDLEKQAAAAGFSLIERMPCWHAGKLLVGWQLLLHRA